MDQRSVGIVLTDKAGTILPEWMLLNNRPRAVRLQGSFGAWKERFVKRNSLINSAFTATNSSTDTQKGEFYDGLTPLVRSNKDKNKNNRCSTENGVHLINF